MEVTQKFVREVHDMAKKAYIESISLEGALKSLKDIALVTYLVVDRKGK